MVQFFHYGERETVFARSEMIRNRFKIRIEEDFPPLIDNRRRELYPIMKAIRKSQVNAYKRNYVAKIQYDKLLVNGKAFTVDTLNQLPDAISTEKLTTIKRGDTIIFRSKYSPLSNFYQSDQKQENVTYNCNEQRYTHKKALTFNDHDTAGKILKEKTPVNQKRLGTKTKRFDHKIWSDRKVDIMAEGLEAKFTQNEYLKNFLLNTGEATLVEASPEDKFWGAGHSIDDPRIWNTRRWSNTAKNTLGELLMELRRHLKGQQQQQPDPIIGPGRLFGINRIVTSV